MKTLSYKIIGTHALLMHNAQTANPLNKLTKKLKQVTSKKNKTDDDHLLISEIEFEASLYYHEKTGYYMPVENIDATFLASAKHFKLGVLWKQAVFFNTERPSFIFKHNTLAPAHLYKQSEYVDIRAVNIQGKKNMRCRPIFYTWEFIVDLTLDEAKLNEAQVDQIVINAGLYIGLCDYRPRYGRFTVEKL